MKILWIGTVWPEPDGSAAGSRTMQLLDVCQQPGHELRFVSPCQESSYQQALEERGIHTARLVPNDPTFDAYISDYKPDLVCFDRFMIEEQFSWRVREHVPDAVRVLDTVDLHSLRRDRQRSVASGEPASSWPLSDDTLRELAAIYRSDLSLIISRAEASFLTGSLGVPSSLLEITGFLYPEPPPFGEWEERTNVVFIGNGLHEPNLDAVRELKRTLWQNIRAALAARGEPNVEIHIYGAYLPQEIMRFDDPQAGFRVMGKADDVHETLRRYRCNLAPLRFGAGLKGKISDGWMAGTPCVATPIAAEGMTVGEAFGGAIEGCPEQYSQRVGELYTNKGMWHEAQANGRRVLETLFSKSQNAQTFLARLAKLAQEKATARQHNIVGSLLWHQSLRSTEYFSRWIECKNRKS